MVQRTYSVSEMRRAIKESTDNLKKDYKPVKFNDSNKQINDKAYKDAYKQVGEFDYNLGEKTNKITNYPQNYRGMETLHPQNMSKEMQDRFNAQAEGYVDAEYKKNHKNEPLGNGTYNDGSISKAFAKRSAAEKKNHDKAVEIGLTGSKSGAEKDDDNMFKEGKTYKLTFKRTAFLTEAQMLSKVPDSLKVEGKKFIMRDKNNTEYLVEWHEEPKVLNKTQINEQRNRIKELFNYKSNVVKSSNDSRIAENKSFDSVLSKARKLMN